MQTTIITSMKTNIISNKKQRM